MGNIRVATNILIYITMELYNFILNEDHTLKPFLLNIKAFTFSISSVLPIE